MDKQEERQLEYEYLQSIIAGSQTMGDALNNIVNSSFRKAPKNERQPFNKNLIADALKEACAESLRPAYDFNKPDDWPVKFKSFYLDLYKRVMDKLDKFGSSGKRPLYEEQVAIRLWKEGNEIKDDKSGLLFTNKWSDLAEDIKEKYLKMAKLVCKEFSTAEVSEERLWEIIWNRLKYSNVLKSELMELKDAIKAELEGK